MTQPQARPRQSSGDEGALQTSLIMAEVKRRRLAKDPVWSAERLAVEMTDAGVPWNRHIVVNLEQGRRKSLRVHELLALAWVLDVDNPLDLLVPQDPKSRLYPVTPSTLLVRDAVRAWWLGETGALREWLAQPREDEQEDLGEMLKDAPPELREHIIMLARSGVQAPRAGGDG